VQDYMAQFGVSPSLLPLVIIVELGGGLCVAFGLLVRPSALALAGFCVLAALLFHRDGSYNETLQLQKDIAIAGGFLILAAHGAGGWSLDAWIKRRGGV
jgi:putative oxidoreductase